MKKNEWFINKIVIATVAASGILSLLGCGMTEIEDVVDNPEDYSVVYLRQAVDAATSYVFPVNNDEYLIMLNANYGGIDYPGADITVGISAMPELADAYNEGNATNYPVLPTDCYTLEQTSAIIPKGKLYSSTVRLKINTLNMPGIASHLLPVGISSVSNGYKRSEDMSVAYFLIEGTYLSNPYPLFGRALWEVTSTSVNGANVVSRLLDDDTATYWSSALNASTPHEIWVDMKETKLVHGCIINARRASANPNLVRESGNPIDVEILTSGDNINWDYSNRYTLTYKSESSDGELDKPEEILYLDYAQDARYVKIRIHKSTGVNYTWFSELNLF